LWDQSQSGGVGIFFRALEKRLQTNTYAHEGLSQLYMLSDRFQEATFGKLREAMAEMANTGHHESLQ
jgi:hypothetical protein